MVLGSAVNNDGAQRVGFTAPSVQGQVRVLRKALAVGGGGPAPAGGGGGGGAGGGVEARGRPTHAHPMKGRARRIDRR